MKVYRDISNVKKLHGVVATNGVFDGVHRGHKFVFEKIIKAASKLQSETIVITYHPHPRNILQKNTPIKLLTTLDEKIEIIKKTGIDHLLVLPFSTRLSNLTAFEFIQNILIDTIGVKRLIIGEDHVFGRKGTQEVNTLLSLCNIEVERPKTIVANNEKISSSTIRDLLMLGDLEKCNHLLGHDYLMTGTVIAGNKLGRVIGFPTANLKIPENKLLPPEGVYAVRIVYNEEVFCGMMNIGFKPTTQGASKNIGVEVHIFDFDKKIYGEEIKVHCAKKIRREKKFNTIELLKQQLIKDKKMVLNVLQN